MADLALIVEKPRRARREFSGEKEKASWNRQYCRAGMNEEGVFAGAVLLSLQFKLRITETVTTSSS